MHLNAFAGSVRFESLAFSLARVKMNTKALLFFILPMYLSTRIGTVGNYRHVKVYLTLDSALVMKLT